MFFLTRYTIKKILAKFAIICYNNFAKQNLIIVVIFYQVCFCLRQKRVFYFNACIENYNMH